MDAPFDAAHDRDRIRTAGGRQGRPPRADAGWALLSHALPRLPPSRLLALTNPPLRSVFGDDPHRVDYAGHVAQDRQHDVDPEVLADPHLQEHPEGRYEYGDDDTE